MVSGNIELAPRWKVGFSSGYDFNVQFRHAFNAAEQPVTRHHGTNAGRRAGEDQIARLEPVVVRQVSDGIGHTPDHLRQIALLTQLPVHVQRNLARSVMAVTCNRVDGGDRRRLIE